MPGGGWAGFLCLGNSFSSHEHVEDWLLLDVVHCLLVGDHGEVVAIQLEDLIVHTQTSGKRANIFHAKLSFLRCVRDSVPTQNVQNNEGNIRRGRYD